MVTRRKHRSDPRVADTPKRLNPRTLKGRAERVDMRWPSDLLGAVSKVAFEEERGIPALIRLIVRRDMERRGLIPKRREHANPNNVPVVEAELTLGPDLELEET